MVAYGLFKDSGFFTVMWCKAQRHADCVELLRAEKYEVADPGVVHKTRVGRAKTKTVRWVYVERPLFSQYLIVKLNRRLPPSVLRAMALRWMGFGVSDGKLWTMPDAEARQWAEYSDARSQDGSFKIGAEVTAKGRGQEHLHGVTLKVRGKTQSTSGAWVYECELPGFLTKSLVFNLDEAVLKGL